MTKEIFKQICNTYIQFLQDCDKLQESFQIDITESNLFSQFCILFESHFSDISQKDFDIIQSFINENCYDMDKGEWRLDVIDPLKIWDQENNETDICDLDDLYEYIYANN